MSYCTVAQLREALAPGVWDTVTGPPSTQTAADLPDTQLQDAADEGSAIVDTAIGGRYATPVAPLDPSANPLVYPHPVDFWSRNIAAYLATCTYRGSSDFTDNDPIYRRYLTTVNALNDIKSGIGVLPLPPVDPAGSASGAGQVVNPYTGNLFTADDFDLVPMTRPPGLPRVSWDWP